MAQTLYEVEREEASDLLWAEEAERRYQEIERGEVIPVSSEEVFREARIQLRFPSNRSLGTSQTS